jgi:hypothetical protein
VPNDDDIDATTQALAQMTKTHDAWADAVRQQIDEERRKRTRLARLRRPRRRPSLFRCRCPSTPRLQ